MKYCAVITLLILLLFLVGCQKTTPVCPAATGTPHYLTTSPEKLSTPTPSNGSYSVEIGRKIVQMDKVISGPLCNDTLKGNVYVACDVQVYPWEENPTFLKNCQLNIEPGTVVYVAYHNNTAYYNGCSCHTGVTPEP